MLFIVHSMMSKIRNFSSGGKSRLLYTPDLVWLVIPNFWSSGYLWHGQGSGSFVHERSSGVFLVATTPLQPPPSYTDLVYSGACQECAYQSPVGVTRYRFSFIACLWKTFDPVSHHYTTRALVTPPFICERRMRMVLVSQGGCRLDRYIYSI